MRDGSHNGVQRLRLTGGRRGEVWIRVFVVDSRLGDAPTGVAFDVFTCMRDCCRGDLAAVVVGQVGPRYVSRVFIAVLSVGAVLAAALGQFSAPLLVPPISTDQLVGERPVQAVCQ